MITAQTRLTLGDSVLGTPEYMSPEQARGDEHIDHRADLYSVGVVLYEMLTGRTPFRADTPSAVIHQILNVDPPEPRKFNKDVDPVLASLSLRLMAKEPEDRLASAAEALGALDADEPVRLPRGPSRRWSRHLLTGALALVLLVAVGWWLMPMSAPQTRTVHDVEVHPSSPSTVRAIYRDRADWETFHRFPKTVVLSDAVLVDLDGSGKQAVIVASETPLDDDDRSRLVAFGSNNDELWRLDFCQQFHWPNDDEPMECWPAVRLAADDLDGVPGDEVAVAAYNSEQYAARISIVDPRTKAVRSTFWHMGQIRGIMVKQDFFEGTRPAIVAWGVNNKLDGFDKETDGLDKELDESEDRRPGDDVPVTGWDIVPVVMILDPQNMDGLGPPRTNRMPGIKGVLPHAYGCLTLSQSYQSGCRVPETAKRRSPLDGEIACIAYVSRIRGSERADGGPWFEVVIDRRNPEGKKAPGGAKLKLDRALGFRQKTALSGEQHRDDEYWRNLWHPIIQNGEYVNH